MDKRKELRWLYKNCPQWGGRLRRGEAEDVHSPLFQYLTDGLIRAGADGYYLTQKGVDYAFGNK